MPPVLHGKPGPMACGHRRYRGRAQHAHAIPPTLAEEQLEHPTQLADRAAAIAARNDSGQLLLAVRRPRARLPRAVPAGVVHDAEAVAVGTMALPRHPDPAGVHAEG